MKKEQYILLGLAALAVIWFATRRTATPESYEQSPDPDEDNTVEENQEEETEQVGHPVPDITLTVDHQSGTNLEAGNTKAILKLNVPEGYVVTSLFGVESIDGSDNIAGVCTSGYYPLTFNVPGNLIRSTIQSQLTTQMLQSGIYTPNGSSLLFLMEATPAGTVPIGNCTGSTYTFYNYLTPGWHEILEIAFEGQGEMSGQIGFMLATPALQQFPVHFTYEGTGVYQSSTYINCQEL